MHRRIRTSTVALVAVFALTLATYLLVRPADVPPLGTVSTTTTSTTSASVYVDNNIDSRIRANVAA